MKNTENLKNSANSPQNFARKFLKKTFCWKTPKVDVFYERVLNNLKYQEVCFNNFEKSFFLIFRNPRFF